MVESSITSWRPSRLQIIIAACAGGAVLLVLLMVILAQTAPATIPRGTTVEGVDIGGLGRDAAVAKVRDEVAKPSAAPMEFAFGDEVFVVKPRKAGVWVNAVDTVEPLLRTSWNPFSRFIGIGGGGEVDPVVVVEEEKFALQMGAFERLVASDVAEPSLDVEGTVISYTPGSQGRTVDEVATRELIIETVSQPRSRRELPVVITEPLVTVENAEAAYAFAQSAVSGPVRVQVEDVKARIPAKTIGDALSFRAVGGDYVPVLDGAILREPIVGDLRAVEEDGEPASIEEQEDGSIVVVAGTSGTGVENEVLASTVLSVLGTDVSEGGKRTVVVPVGQRETGFEGLDIDSLKLQDKLSSFTQKFDYAAYRVTNIGQAAEYVNGTVLMPGEEFSMNDTIKERTEENGYTEGTIIGPGGVFEEALGGGVSAATTAVWTAAFFAGMERVFTRAHSVYISRYQPGLEATVAWGIFDMKFRNDTANPVLITTKMTNSSVTVEFWGTKEYDEIKAEFGERTNIKKPEKVYRPKKNCTPQKGIPGFSINVDRVFYKDEAEVKRETIRTFYLAAPKVICGKPPKDNDLNSEDAAVGDSDLGDPGTLPDGSEAGVGEDPLDAVPAGEVAVD